MDFEPAPFLRRLALAVAAVLIGATAAAQIPVPAVVDPNADAPVQTGVSVDDSGLAVDRMALATRLEGEKEWNKSAEVYQEVIEKYRDRVVAVPTNTQGLQDLIAQYTSVLNLVNQHLRQWPPEGLAVYRAHYELTAQALVQDAHGDDLGKLHEAFSRYFVTDAGKQAGLKLIDAYLEMGDFNAAIWIGNELRLHPTLDADTPKVLFRIGLAAHFSGDLAAAQSAWQDLKTGYPNATATIGGRDVTLVTELSSYLGRPLPLTGDGASAQPGNSWPTLGGDDSRGKIYSSLAQPQARLYSFKLPIDVPLQDRNQARDYLTQNQSFRGTNPGAAVGIMPVVDRGELYFQDNAHVYALGLESGRPLPGWTADSTRKFGRYTVDGAWTLPNGRQLGLTLTDTLVLGVMNVPELFTAPSDAAGFRTGQIVCLDRAAGAEQWTFSPSRLPDASLQQISLGGTPLVVGNSVYCMGRISNENEIRCYVLCLDLGTGALRWSCYVATAPNTGPVISQDSRYLQLADNFSSLAYAGGRIFVSTNFGAVAALDAYGGTIDWLNVYKKPDDSIDQRYLNMNRGWPGRFNNFNGNGNVINTPNSPGTPPAWIGNTPIVHNGKVFVLPPDGDGDDILVYDADHGQVVKMLNKADCCPTSLVDGSHAAAPPRTLLGVIDGATVLDGGQDRPEDLLLLGTDRQVFAIKWREYDPANPSAAVAWATTPGAAETVAGRTMVTANHLYIPGSVSLHYVSLRNGAIEQNYPALDAPWPADEGPGNVVACADHVVIASDTHINVYTNLSVDRARLEGQIAATPADADTRLQYAETLFLANQPSEAVKKLDDAIQLLPRGNTPQAVATRNRAFADALDFGVKSWRVPAAAAARDLPGGDRLDDRLDRGKILADGFFRRAAGLAQSPGQQVNYRLAAARFARYGNQDIGAAIKLYQEILSDAAMRSSAAVDKDDINGLASATPQLQSLPLQAGRVAAAAIESMMSDQKGHLAYGPYEQAAADELAAATAAKDPARMANVALSYPNSTIWGTAAFAAIDGYERVGLYPQALQLLRYVYAIVAPDNVHDRVVILQKMAADYMQIPGRVEVALGRLEAADELERTAGLLTPFRLAGGKILPIGTPVIAAINELVHALPDQGAAETARLAAFGFPSSLADRDYYQKNHVHPQPLLPEDPATAIPNVTALLAPDQPYARYDRVVAWTAGAGLSIYPVGSTHPLGTNPDARTEPRGTAWVASKSDPIKSDAPKSDLLAWNSASLTLIGGEDARTRWTVDMLSQPALDVMAPRPVPPKYEALVPQQQMPFGGPFGGGFGRGFGRGGRNRQGLLINGQQIFQRQATQSAGAASAATDAADDSIETIAAVRPVAGLAIVSTTAGRIMAVDLAAGAVRWQVRVSTHALDRLEATDDFTVLKTTDDPNGLIMALDTVTGRLIWHRSFGGEDQIAEPVNFALGQDGRLAFTTTDQLFIVQLFEAMRLSDPQGGMVPPTPQQAGAEPFARMDQPGQLLVTDGQVLAIGIENGQYELFDYNAETGQPRILGNGETNLRLDNCDEKTVLQPAGAYVYAWCPKAIAAHNLENPALGWQQSFQGRADARQLLLGRDYLVVMGRAPGDDGAQTWTLTAYLRSTPTIPSGAESGRIVYTPSITNPAGIVAFQMIDGGLCYLSNDHVLHTLTANRNPTPPTAPTPPTPPTAP